MRDERFLFKKLVQKQFYFLLFFQNINSQNLICLLNEVRSFVLAGNGTNEQ